MKTIELGLKCSQVQSELFFPDSHFPKYTIAPKGRRAGLTKGAANAFIEYCLSEDFWFLPPGPLFLLWVDAINANIDRYFERYFYPELRKIDSDQWKWKQQEKTLKLGRGTIDFRSAEKPESIEGFGYHLIFMNESGIILEDNYLFDNTIMPMLMDFPGSKLIAAGTPKGKRHKDGIHKFYELYQKGQHDKENYRIFTFTGRQNPFIDRAELEKIAAQMDEATRRQEIDGEFCDTTERKFLYAVSEGKHIIDSYTPNPHLPILCSFDFNKDPMTCVIGQQVDDVTSYIFDEIEMNSGSTPEVCDEIKKKYPEWIFNIQVTGDATGRNRSALTRGNLNHYRIIKEELKLLDRDILVTKANPALKDSRILCNSVLQNAQHFITKNCTGVINDLFSANVDSDGELIKNSQIGLHLFDGWRYLIHAVYPDWISNPRKYSTHRTI